MGHKRTPSLVVVSILDLTDLKANALEFIQSEIDPAATTVSTLTWGKVETMGGDIYCLNTEGVGPSKPITENNRLVIQFHVDGYSDGRKFFPCDPQAQAVVDDDWLRNAAITDRVMLHEFIREFGERLESNYRIWDTVLSEALTVA